MEYMCYTESVPPPLHSEHQAIPNNQKVSWYGAKVFLGSSAEGRKTL